MLLLTIGGLITFVTSILLAFESLTGQGEGERTDLPAKAESDELDQRGARRRPRSFIFIGFIAVPFFFGGFWGGSPRHRVLGALYLAGVVLAASGALLLLLH